MCITYRSVAEPAIRRERKLRGVRLPAETIGEPAPRRAAMHHALRNVARHRHVQVLHAHTSTLI